MATPQIDHLGRLVRAFRASAPEDRNRLARPLLAELIRRGRGLARGKDDTRPQEYAESFACWLLTDGRHYLKRWDPARIASFWAYLSRAGILKEWARHYRDAYAPEPVPDVGDWHPSTASAPGSSRWLSAAEDGDLVLRVAEAQGPRALATLVLGRYAWFSEYAARLRLADPTDLRYRRVQFAIATTAQVVGQDWDDVQPRLEAAALDRAGHRRSNTPTDLVAELLQSRPATIDTRLSRLGATLREHAAHGRLPDRAVASRATRRKARELLRALLVRQANGQPAVVSYSWLHEHLYGRSPRAWAPGAFAELIALARSMPAEHVASLGEVRLDSFVVRADTGRPGRGHWRVAAGYSPPDWARQLGRARRITRPGEHPERPSA